MNDQKKKEEKEERKKNLQDALDGVLGNELFVACADFYWWGSPDCGGTGHYHIVAIRPTKSAADKAATEYKYPPQAVREGTGWTGAVSIVGPMSPVELFEKVIDLAVSGA